MLDIYILLVLFLIVWYFIYLRKISESARTLATNYCDKENLQFIALARLASRLTFSKQKGFYWLSQFSLEFSSDGEASYQGTMTLHGLKLNRIQLPPYRIQ